MNRHAKLFRRSLEMLTFVGLLTTLPLAGAENLQVPFAHAKGNKLYQQNCAICHGETMTGTKQGPPLLHPFYKPSHHADFSFYNAALKGVQAHHWEFGDMPPIQGITREDMDAIVPFIRWYQKEKGLIK